MSTPVICIGLPQLVFVDDYHEFTNIQLRLQDLSPTDPDNGKKARIHVSELGFTGTAYVAYVGLVYAGRRPSKDEITELLAKEKVSIDDRLL